MRRAVPALAALLAASAAGERAYAPMVPTLVWPGLACDDLPFTGGCNCDMQKRALMITVATAGGGTCAPGDRMGESPFMGGQVVGTWDATYCNYLLEGTTSLRHYVEILTTLPFVTTATDMQPREITFTLGGGIYNKHNGHFYEHVGIDKAREYPNPGSDLQESWRAAQQWCAHPDQDILGLVGYLATITTAGEKAFLDAHMNSIGWLGGADVGDEGSWRWIVGPEGCAGYLTAPTDPVLRRSMCDVGDLAAREPGCTGTQCTEGTPFGYTNWEPGEPNAAYMTRESEGEDFLHSYRNTNWNDFRLTNGRIEAFTCEWGGVGTPCLPMANVTQTETLVVDECASGAASGVCNATAPPQTCRDPSGHAGDWMCMCTVGTQKFDTGVRSLAVCQYDECEPGRRGHNLCVQIGQDCTDASPTAEAQHDFECKCAAPLRGAVGTDGPAGPCTQDECRGDGVGKALCVDVGQQCQDENQTHAGNFVCTCTRLGEYGNATGAAAVCALDECAAAAVSGSRGLPPGARGARTCGAAGQTCSDADHTVDGDFVCTCAGAGETGTATGAAAVCERDECAAGGLGKTLCVDDGHMCVDANRTHSGNFVCTCTGAGRTGTATGGAPVCALDECDAGLALNATCEMAKQTCVEPDEAEADDAYCQCPPPMGAQKRVGGAVAACEWDECADHAATCTNAQQVCEDADKGAMGTWVCKCVHPQEPVDPTQLVGEQTVAGCAFKEGDCKKYAYVCSGTSPAQICGAGEVEWDGRVLCKCPAPYSAPPGKHEHASCTLDECAVVCPWCDKTEGHGAGTCASAQQACRDADHTVDRDWRCVCADPYDGDSLMSTAKCVVDECNVECPHCADSGNGNACVAADQTCQDPAGDRTARGNWYCECKAPLSLKGARQAAAAADCELNECRSAGGDAVCVAGGQTCADEDTAPDAVGDWACTCADGFRTVATAQAAVCEEDECADQATAAVCTDAGQVCNDTDFAALATWECRCVGVAAGVASMAAADCRIDECSAACDHCADVGNGNVCAGAGQECYEPDSSAASVGDWWCVCPRPGGVKARPGAAVPSCPERNECRDPTAQGAAQEGTHVPRYTKSGCLCANDWRLSAEYCSTHGLTCSGPGFDAPCPRGCCNPDADAGGDWCILKDHPFNAAKAKCSSTAEAWEYCVPLGVTPAGGGPPRPFPRNGTFPGVPDSASNVCADVGQSCEDGAADVDGDWRCVCVAPLVGDAGRAPATCGLDECVQHNDTCALAEPAGSQRCVDPTPSPQATGDWRCECAAGGETADQAAVAACPLDECDQHKATCEGMQQTCADRNATTASLQDWYCECVLPMRGSGRMVAAVCELDECEGPCDGCAVVGAGAPNVCRAAGQTCLDPERSMGSRGDWKCLCDDPSLTEAVAAAAAACLLDECVDGDGLMCLGAAPPQECMDADHTALNNWECVCTNGTVGHAAQQHAVCQEDECDAHRATCTTEGQKCLDTDLTAPGTWYCQCVLPDEHGGDALMAAAACNRTRECVNNTVCAAARQVCHDDATAPDVLNNWECHCIGDYTGAPGMQGPATCTLDECTLTAAAVCAEHAQACVDVDLEADGTWACRCAGNATGAPGVASVANCTLDECTAVCATCADGVCAAAFQDCVDLDTAVFEVGNWECRCRGASPNVATAKAVPSCLDNECLLHNATCTGAAPPQDCVDPDPSAAGDWECRCKPGMAAVIAVASAAVGCDAFDECAAQCAHCADAGAGNVCDAAWQDCRDAAPFDVHHNWECICRGRASGAQVGAPVAVCVLDECTTVCDSCALHGAKDICAAAGQTCVEGERTPYALGDWRCVCAAPLDFVSSQASTAACAVDECVDVVGGANPGVVCTDAGQICADPDRATLGDYECACPAPREGRAVAAAAACTLDECNVAANVRLCEGGATTPGAADPQACHDPNHTVAGDWRCRCPPPSHGSERGAAAACGVDECEDAAHRQTCAGAGSAQRCEDGDHFAVGDWACVCQSGGARQTAAPATCERDECAVDCSTCENGACAAAAQECHDPARLVNETNDWVCTCKAPAQGAAVGAAVDACLYDECAEAGKCPDGQRCDDAQQGSLGNWECVCPLAPLVRAVAAAAACPVDECADAANALVCQRAGQQCVDDKLADRLGNWECHCGALFGGAPKVAAPATCVQPGECDNAVTAAVCTDAGQVCFDPDEAVAGDWACLCVAPATGAPAVGQPAVCGVDECAANGLACTSAEQSCVDADRGVFAVGDWECHCYAPQVGVRTGGPAACADGNRTCADECEANRPTCVTAGQSCVDPEPCVEADWECRCIRAASKSNVGAPVASCATPCSAINDGCACQEADGCAWLADDAVCVERQYGACPALDLVVLLDGSGSLVYAFDEVIDGLQAWVRTLPLSGDNADAVSSGLANHSVRVAFVQYSGTFNGEKAQVTPAGTGTGGRLSGSATELVADLEWHRRNYMAEKTFIGEGLGLAADILATSPVDGRRRAVYIVSDGKLDDAGSIAPEVARLHASGDPEVFGIVVRKADAHTDVDLEAEATVKPLVSAPQDDHFINLNVHELASAHGPLATICDPTTPLGRHLAPQPVILDECGVKNGAEDGSRNDRCQDWWTCYGWVILVVLLLCSSCFALLLALRQRQEKAEDDGTKWNTFFEASGADAGGEYELGSVDNGMAKSLLQENEQSGCSEASTTDEETPL